MFKVNVKGPWRPLRGLLKNYDKRIAYVRRVLGKDVAEAFLAELRKRAPQGEEYVAYLDSLEEAKLRIDKGWIAPVWDWGKGRQKGGVREQE